MGIPSSAFSRLCAALRTPMASFSSSSCGWLRGWLQQVLVKQSARSLEQSIFGTYKDLGKKTPKNPQHQNPPEAKASYSTRDSFISLLQRGGTERGCEHHLFSFICFTLGFASAKHYFASWCLIHMRTGILIPNTS